MSSKRLSVRDVVQNGAAVDCARDRGAGIVELDFDFHGFSQTSFSSLTILVLADLIAEARFFSACARAPSHVSEKSERRRNVWRQSPLPLKYLSAIMYSPSTKTTPSV